MQERKKTNIKLTLSVIFIKLRSSPVSVNQIEQRNTARAINAELTNKIN